MLWTVLLGSIPWLALGAFVLLRVREPPELTGAAPRGARPRPAVSVIVPARNEAHNIERCLGSLTASDYPDFEVIVVDDRSEDDTGFPRAPERARGGSQGPAIGATGRRRRSPLRASCAARTTATGHARAAGAQRRDTR